MPTDAAPLALLAGRPPRNCARSRPQDLRLPRTSASNTILDAISDKVSTASTQISDATGAGTGCGSCRPEIERLLHNARAAESRCRSQSPDARKGEHETSDLKKSGHWPTLLSAFLYFDISFMAWVSLGPLMVYIAKEMNIPIEQKLTLVAIPVLSGAILRIPLGILADTIGFETHRTCIAQVVMTIACALCLEVRAADPNAVAIFGALLGLGGASFAVALPQASRWYPPQLQGMVMGIAGAGNMGVVLDTLFAPTIAEAFRLAGGLRRAADPDDRHPRLLHARREGRARLGQARSPLAAYGKLLLDADSRWFMFFYFITFGGFVGLASALPLYFTKQFHVTPVAAGLMVSLIVFFGSTFRPVGGAIADRIGGIKSLTVMFLVVSACYFARLAAPRRPGAGGGRLDADGASGDGLAGGGAVLGRHAVPRHGQWRGVPVAAAALPQRSRRDDRPRRLRRRPGRLLPRQGAGDLQGHDRRFHGRLPVLRLLALLGVAGLSFVKTRWRTTWGAASGARI